MAGHPIRTSIILIAALALTSGCSSSSSLQPLKSEWIRTEMFFGLTEFGKPISDAQWHDFIDRSITPRFPDGLTFEYGSGQYRANNHELIKERTAILILLHKKETYRRDDALLTSIAHDYDIRFHQDSVLRCDSDAQVKFISAEPGSGG